MKKAILPCMICSGMLALVVLLLRAGPQCDALRAASPNAAADTAERSAGSIVPDHMTISGDVATVANCTDAVVCSWLATMPAGSILLGVDPGSSNPADWDGGSAQVQFMPTWPVAELSFSWLGWEEIGIRAYRDFAGPGASIAVNGTTFWHARPAQWDDACQWPPGQTGCYQHLLRPPVLTTLVSTGTVTQTLVVSASPGVVWPLSSITVQEKDMPGQLKGIGYAPLRYCQDPGGGAQPSEAEIEADLDILAHLANGVRTYSCGGVMADFAGRANAHGLPVRIGVWLDQDLQGNDAELSCAIAAASTYTLTGVVIGNEVLYRGDLTVPQVISYVNQANEAMQTQDVRVGIAELWWVLFEPDLPGDAFYRHRDLIEVVDDVLLHIYGYWDKVPADQAAQYVVDRYVAIRDRVQADYPDKRVILGETGWPTNGDPHGAAVASLNNQMRFLADFLSLAEQENVDFYYFSAFDGAWKIVEGSTGPHWGFGTDGRNAKHGLWGVLFQGESSPMPPVPTAFPVYSEHNSSSNHFYASGWMGDSGNINYDECWLDRPHQGEMAIRIAFTPGPQGWAGIYWQQPPNNWCDLAGSCNLSSAQKLTFWARGEHGGERITFGVGGMGCDTAEYSRTVDLPATWQRYEFPLAGADLSHIVGGFFWAAGGADNPQGSVFYLDDVQYDAGLGCSWLESIFLPLTLRNP